MPNPLELGLRKTGSIFHRLYAIADINRFQATLKVIDQSLKPASPPG